MQSRLRGAQWKTKEGVSVMNGLQSVDYSLTSLSFSLRQYKHEPLKYKQNVNLQKSGIFSWSPSSHLLVLIKQQLSQLEA